MVIPFLFDPLDSTALNASTKADYSRATFLAAKTVDVVAAVWTSILFQHQNPVRRRFPTKIAL
jgi:hypothetical protein